MPGFCNRLKTVHNLKKIEKKLYNSVIVIISLPIFIFSIFFKISKIHLLFIRSYLSFQWSQIRVSVGYKFSQIPCKFACKVSKIPHNYVKTLSKNCANSLQNKKKIQNRTLKNFIWFVKVWTITVFSFINGIFHTVSKPAIL